MLNRKKRILFIGKWVASLHSVSYWQAPLNQYWNFKKDDLLHTRGMMVYNHANMSQFNDSWVYAQKKLVMDASLQSIILT